MKRRRIDRFVDLIPEALLDVSGSAFYSGRRAFNSPSRLYLLGLNPAGDPSWRSTVRMNVDAVLNGPEDWSAWRDESWGRKPPGRNYRQLRVLHLMEQIGMDAGAVPCSEVVFSRSTDPNKLDIDALARLCWPFHQSVIETLGVRVVVCLGGRAGRHTRHRLGAHRQIDEYVETNGRRWKSRTHENSSGLAVVTLAHPSQADWTARSSDPTGLVKRSLG